MPAVIVAGGLIFSAGARGGESIIFSSPPGGEVSNTPSLSPKPSDEAALARPLPAPEQLFQFQLAPQNFSAPQPAVSAAEQQRLQKILDDKSDWAFLTPEEILGVKPENADDAQKQDDRTPMERYLDRQQQLRSPGVTNSYSLADENENPSWNSSEADTNYFSRSGGYAGTFWNRLLNGNQRNMNYPGQNNNSAWSLFSSPRPQEQSTKPDPAQQAAMERFQQLLNPSFAPAADASSFSAAKVATDPNFTQPDFTPNPAGASFVPVTCAVAERTPLAGMS